MKNDTFKNLLIDKMEEYKTILSSSKIEYLLRNTYDEWMPYYEDYRKRFILSDNKPTLLYLDRTIDYFSRREVYIDSFIDKIR